MCSEQTHSITRQLAEMTARVRELEDENADLKRQLDQMSETLDLYRMQAKKKPEPEGPGR